MDNTIFNVDKINLQQHTLQTDGFTTYFMSLSAKEQRDVIKQLENKYLSKGDKPEFIKGIVIDRIARHKGGKYMKFFISNIDELDFNGLINNLYGLLFTNTKFKTFSRNKIVDIKSKSANKSILISRDNRINNLTTKDEFTRTIKRNILESGSLSRYFSQVEIVVWKERFKSPNRDGLLKNESIIS